jgi:hypothetical protein
MLRLLLYLSLWFGSMGLAIFSSQNIYLVTVKFIYLESIKLPLGLVLVFCAGLGAIAMTLLMEFSRKSFQFSVPNIPQFTNSGTKTTFSKNSTESQKTTSKIPFNNSSTNKKSNTKDDFESDWDDDWE